jgi:hypothetical protein
MSFNIGDRVVVDNYPAVPTPEDPIVGRAGTVVSIPDEDNLHYYLVKLDTPCERIRTWNFLDRELRAE